MKELLRHHGLQARKSLGQHFLSETKVLAKIVEAAGLTRSDLVVEVGPGLGTLTRALAARAGRVIAVEVDGGLVSLLRERLSHLPNVTIVSADILDLAPEELVASYGSAEVDGAGSRPQYKMVANLPYNIAAVVLRHFLEAEHKPNRMVVMVQKEVGEVIAASPDPSSPGRMGLLSLGVQVYGRPSIVARVPASHFYPRPKVDAVVVAIDVYESPAVQDPQSFFTTARAGFSAPRKQLHNGLALGLGVPVAQAKEALKAAGIDGRRRPSTLTLEEWEGLSRVLP
ncbi:MAG: 16S rRNA (adenine(1518)-N(6)/adenine(1519)-N(6))-dimethyltransferase RsmA [Dehalococcoidia bacterium]